MKSETFQVKSKGQVVGEATVNLPESLNEAMADEAGNLSAMWYGLRVRAANVVRSAATGGPKSLSGMIAAKIKDNPEALEKIKKLLGIE